MRPSWIKKLELPVIQAPMFLVSNPQLVIASCMAGIVGTFPALNPRTEDLLDEWLRGIKNEIGQKPYGVNLIVHKTNIRLKANVDMVIKHKVPLIITSLGAVKDIVDEVHSYGGVVFHDVTNIKHARKAIDAGVDGIIAICAGGGGHSGVVSPFALIPQIRAEFDGIICVGGSISTGGAIKASQCLGGDLAYMGTRFIPTVESGGFADNMLTKASQEYKQMCVDSKSGPSPTFMPVIYTDKIRLELITSGVHANFMIDSLVNNRIDPEKIVGDGFGQEDFSKLNSDSASAWKDIWSAGQGILNIHDIPTVKNLVTKLKQEYYACQ